MRAISNKAGSDDEDEDDDEGKTKKKLKKSKSSREGEGEGDGAAGEGDGVIIAPGQPRSGKSSRNVADGDGGADSASKPPLAANKSMRSTLAVPIGASAPARADDDPLAAKRKASLDQYAACSSMHQMSQPSSRKMSMGRVRRCTQRARAGALAHAARASHPSRSPPTSAECEPAHLR